MPAASPDLHCPAGDGDRTPKLSLRGDKGEGHGVARGGTQLGDSGTLGFRDSGILVKQENVQLKRLSLARTPEGTPEVTPEEVTPPELPLEEPPAPAQPPGEPGVSPWVPSHESHGSH